MEGLTKSEATAKFYGSDMCRAFGDNLIFANIDGLAAAAGYED